MKKSFVSAVKKEIPFLLTVILFLVFGISYAEDVRSFSGKELSDKIHSSKKSDNDYALGYITGVYCVYMETSVPDERTMKKVVKIVRKYLKKNPEKLNESAVELLKEVFDKAFRDKKQ